MPDTDSNQKPFPQPGNQKPGLGFPMARGVVLFCWSTGVVLNAIFGSEKGKKSGETSLFRQMDGFIEVGDVILFDSCYAGYCDVAYWAGKGADIVVASHSARKVDFRTGRRLGRKDHIVIWHKPPCPACFDKEVYDTLPDQMEMREVEISIYQTGFRPKKRVIATTLLDAKEHSAKDLGEFYQTRWDAELNLNSLKTTMGMAHLSSKTEQMVRKEIWMHLLAYNLVRGLMVQAGQRAGCKPNELSFKGTLDRLQAFASLTNGISEEVIGQMIETLLDAIGKDRVRQRPGRSEPRKVKRRKKNHST